MQGCHLSIATCFVVSVVSQLNSFVFFSGGSHEGVGRKKKLNSFVFCLSWLSCDPVSLARLSYSVRGVGNRPEPWADDLAEAMKALVGKKQTQQQNTPTKLDERRKTKKQQK